MRWPLASTVLAAALLSPSARADGPPPAEAPSPQAYAPPLAPYAPYGAYGAPPLAAERRSRGMMITGIVLWGAGGVATAVGAGIFFEGLSQTCLASAGVARGPAPPPAPRHARRGAAPEPVGVAPQAFYSCGDANPDLGFGIMTAGILSGLAAIPIYLVGNMKVRARPHVDDGLVPAVHVGIGSADLRWTF